MPETRILGVSFATHSLGRGQALGQRPDATATFYHVLDGRLKLVAEGLGKDGLVLDAGDSVAFGACVPHSLVPLRRAANAYCDATVFAGHMGRRRTPFGRPADYVLVPSRVVPAAQIIRHCVEMVLLETERDYCNEEVVIRCAEIVQMELIRQTDDLRRSIGPVETPNDVAKQVMEAWTAFLDSPQEAWSIDRLSSLSGLGRTAFYEKFSEIMGTSPLRAIRKVRMDYAQNLLAGTDLRISTIAQRTGYASDAAFIRAFQRECGLSPTLFRHQQRNRSDSAPPDG